MQLELPKVQIHNHYDIIIRDIRNNKIIQTAYAENVAQNENFFKSALFNQSGNTGLVFKAFGIQASDGHTDWIEPSSITDPTIVNNFVDDKKMFYKVSNYANTITFSAIFLPTHKFIGTFTKVGIKGKQLFVSEAAIQDVEGNVIQVEKNNFNQIEIKVTLYYNYIIPQGKKQNIIYQPFIISELYSVTLNLNNLFSTQLEYFAKEVPKNLILNENNVSKYAISLDGFPYNNIKYFHQWIYYYPNTDNNTHTPFSFTYPPKSMPQEGLIKAVRLKSTIVIPFPNYEICPKYIYKNYRFGIGDGVKTNFSSIILNEIVVNESTLNINEFSYGLLSDNPENNVYFQNADYTKSPLYNQAKYIQICFNDKPAINNKHFIIAELQPLTDDSVPISTKDFPITSSFEIPMCDILYTQSQNTEYMINFKNGDFPCVEMDIDQAYSPDIYRVADKTKIITAWRWPAPAVQYSVGTKIQIDHFVYEAYGPDKNSNNKIDIWATDDLNNINIIQTYTIPTSDYHGREILKSYFYKDPLTKEKYSFLQWGHVVHLYVGGASGYFGRNDYSSEGFYGTFPTRNKILFGNSTMFDFCKNGLNFTTPPNDGDVITIDAMLEYPLMEHDSGLMISGDSTYDPTW